MVSRGAQVSRLLTLLRRFGIQSAELADKDPKAIIASVRAVYFRRAKEEHPDLAPEERKSEAKEKFVKLQQEFSETIKLLEEGIRPGGDVHPANAASMPGDPNLRRTAHWRSEYQFHDARTWASTGGLADEHKPRQKIEFDTVTRLKGMSVLVTGVVIFGYVLREFLVWSAGHQFAWYGPSRNSGFLRVRRFKDEWDNVAKKDREPKSNRKEQQQMQRKCSALQKQ